MARQSLIELAAVIAVARQGAFRRAAVELGLSTTALSNVIARLEADLGVRLFNRTTRSVALTDAGRQFVDRVGPAHAEIHAAMDGVRSQQATPAGVLRINSFAAAARDILAPLLLPFLRQFPHVHLDLVSEGRIVDVVAAGFDFGIRIANLVPSDMIAVSLGPPWRYAVVASPAYLADKPRPRVPADLLAHRCIRARLPDGRMLRWHFEKQDQSILLDVPGPLTLDEASLARIAVLEGVGIGFFLEPDVRTDLAAGRLVQLLADWTPALGPLSLYYANRRNPSAAFKAFVDHARAFGAARAADG